MAYGPIGVIFTLFPGNRFSGDIVPAIEELVASGAIRIIDPFGQQGCRRQNPLREFAELTESDLATFAPMGSEVTGMLSEVDILALSGALEPNSSAGFIVF